MELAELDRCLCDPARRRILHLMQEGPLCVGHFQTILGLPQVTVSRHLASLRAHGMVEAHRHGPWMIDAVRTDRSGALELQLQCLQECVKTGEVFRADLQRLKELRPQCPWVAEALESPRLAPGNNLKAGCRPLVPAAN